MLPLRAQDSGEEVDRETNQARHDGKKRKEEKDRQQ
jgi:hypothetical protein